MAELTPMMQQYQRIKEENGDALLFFRLGDFYEMFGEDAKVASRTGARTRRTRRPCAACPTTPARATSPA